MTSKTKQFKSEVFVALVVLGFNALQDINPTTSIRHDESVSDQAWVNGYIDGQPVTFRQVVGESGDVFYEAGIRTPDNNSHQTLKTYKWHDGSQNRQTTPFSFFYQEFKSDIQSGYFNK